MGREDPYDAIAFEGRVLRCALPGALEPLRITHGLAAWGGRPLRVLDLGCGDGTMLAALATQGWPLARAVGIESAPRTRQVAQHRLAADERVEIRAGDLTASVPALEGPFDLVWGLGLLSWLPRDVVDGLGRWLGATLAPDGLAVLDHDVPAGAAAAAAVEHLLRGASGLSGARERASQLAWLGGPGPHLRHGSRLAARALGLSDGHLRHEVLAPHRRAWWIRSLHTWATGHGLAWVADAHRPGVPWRGGARGRWDRADVASGRRYRVSVLARTSSTGTGREVPLDTGWRVIAAPDIACRPGEAGVRTATGLHPVQDPWTLSWLGCVRDAGPSGCLLGQAAEQVARRAGAALGDGQREALQEHLEAATGTLWRWGAVRAEPHVPA